MYFCFMIWTKNVWRCILFMLSLFFSLPCNSFAQSYADVIFDNSLSNGSYAKSSITYRGDSWIENVNMNLPVSDTLFFTPGNALSLKYISAAKGTWDVRINYGRQKTNYLFNPQDQLSFFIYVNSHHTKEQDLPRIFVKQREGLADTIALDNYISGYATSKWIHVKIPNTAFSKIQKESVIAAVGFAQHHASVKMNHLFVDQIEFLPRKYAAARLTTPAILTEITPFDKMIYLKWQTPLSPGLRYVKIYRSTDGKRFEPTDIRPIYMQSALDVVPQVGQKYYYKIAWVDNDYKESPPSQVKEATTRNMTDAGIVDLVQGAHINYFIENFDINSGMYMPYRSKEKAIVSTKETAGAILSLIVGAENKILPRQVVFQRVSKISFFLMRAQNRYGIFPAYFDGRKGLPDYRRGTTKYDVLATSSIIEALLVAREYFNADNEDERDLRNRITSLYNQINWQAVANDRSLLNAKVSIVDDEVKVNTIGDLISGVNESINTYLLAISAKQYPLPTKSYFEGVYNTYGVQRIGYIQDLDFDVYADSVGEKKVDVANIVNIKVVDTLSMTSIIQPAIKYGVYLPFGILKGSLMDVYKPFTTIRPELIQDSLCNWNDVLKSYSDYVKRRDNESGLGNNNSDIWGFYPNTKDSTANYRINPALAPSSIAFHKDKGERSLLAFFKNYGDVLFTEYGFRSWLDLLHNDESEEYVAANQAMVAVMVENAKTGLIWKLYEQIPELKAGRSRLFAKPSSVVE